AGQVLRVRSDSGQIQAVMKRPVQNVSGGTIVRQAGQIENEGQILAELNGLNARHAGITVTTPLLLDRSIPGTERTANLFVVSQEASGTPIDSLLKGIVRGDNVMSQVLVLRILAGLLQMLKVVHAQDLIWNDVKMEHVYWDAGSYTFCYIDWGNSQKVQGSVEEKAARFKLDYQQLFPEGVLLIRQTAPELIQEIGWPLDGKPLSDNELIQLQFRVEYAAEYFSHRAVEYQLLFKKSLEHLDGLQSLQDLFSLRRALAHLGVKVDDALSLEASQKVALACIRLKDYRQAEMVCELTLQELPPEITGNWQSLAVLFKESGQIQEGLFNDLLEAAVNCQKESFVWKLSQLPAGVLSASTRTQLIVATRNFWDHDKASAPICMDELTKYADELHMMALRSERFETPQVVKDEILHISREVDQILASWVQLAEGHQLGWQALKLKEALQSTPIRPQTELNAALNTLLGKIREVYKAWEGKDLDETSQALRGLLLLDPSLVFLEDIDAEIHNLKTWVETLKTGPKAHAAINRFAQKLLQEFPKAHFWLGLPAWLQDLWDQVSTLNQGQDLLTVQQQALNADWDLPWLQLSSSFVELPEDWVRNFRMTPEQKTAVEAFHRALRSGAPRELALENLHKVMPAFFSGYAQIDGIFKGLFLQGPQVHDFPNPESLPMEDKTNLDIARRAYGRIEDWKQKSCLNRVWVAPSGNDQASDWAIMAELTQLQKDWRKRILPVLSAFKQKDWDLLPDSEPEAQKLDPLLKACHSMIVVYQEWQKIPNQGLYKELIQELQYQLETAQTAFFRFWNNLQLSPSLAMRWLAEEHQPILSGINRFFLQLIRQVKNLGMAYEVINTPEMASTRLAFNSAGDLMFSLVQVQELLEKPGRTQTVIRDWQKQYFDLQKRMDRRSIIEGIRSIESIHPLLPWFDELVRRDADYFTQPQLGD
ncbi:MAG TPA: hypothetical protein VLR89_08835, partial [Anaerolineaceae bacterium]|nr:hypothetical protein [Anaerolineaceae bacterium]